MKNNVLIISGHPDLSQSFANSIILKEVEKLAPEFKVAFIAEIANGQISSNFASKKYNISKSTIAYWHQQTI
jgi:transposase-like protein